jgi:hypothetical protein
VRVTLSQIEHVTLGKVERHLGHSYTVTRTGARTSTRRAPRAPAPRRGAPARAARSSAHRTPGALPRRRGRRPAPLHIFTKLPRPIPTSLLAVSSARCVLSGRSPIRLVRSFRDRTKSAATAPSSRRAVETAAAALRSRIDKRMIPGP